MNKNELQNTLNREGFDPNSYDLDSGLLPDKFTLSNEAGVWHVYYCDERGILRDKQSFSTESEACEYFLEDMRDDPTTRA